MPRFLGSPHRLHGLSRKLGAGATLPFSGRGVDPTYVPVADVTVAVGSLNQALLDAQPINTSFALVKGVHRLTDGLVLKEGQQLLGFPGAILNGSKVIDGWVQDGSNWYVTGQTQRLPYNTPGEWPICLPDYPMCNRTEDVFFDDQPLHQVATLAELTEGKFVFDYDNDRIYLSVDPTGHKVETAVATYAINGSGPNIVLRNLVVEKFGNKSTSGAIQNPEGHADWVIQNCDIRYNHGVGIFVGHGAQIINNKIHHQGQLGLAGHGAGTLVENNEVSYNNVYGYDANNEAGASKWVNTTNLTVRGNWTHHNYGAGFWTDINNIYTTYEDNVVEDNQYQGLFHEISYDAIIRNNIVRRNGRGPIGWDVMGAGILISNSINVDCYGNTVEDNVDGIVLLDDLRGDWEVRNVHVHHNTIRMPGGWSGMIRTYLGDDKLFTAQNNRFTDNTWIVPTSAARWWDWNGSKTWDEWQAIPNDATGTRLLFPPGPGFYVENLPRVGLLGAWALEDGSGTGAGDSGPFGKTAFMPSPQPTWVTEGLDFDTTSALPWVHNTSGMRELTSYHVIAVFKADVAARMSPVAQNGEWYMLTDDAGRPTLALHADAPYHELSLTDSQVGNWVCVDAFRDSQMMGIRLNNDNHTAKNAIGLSKGWSWWGNWQCTFGGSEKVAERFDGKLALVAVYNRRLSDTEMAAVYTELQRIMPRRGISLPNTPAVQAPTGLRAPGGGPTMINLKWDQYVLPGFKNYLLYRDDVLIATITNAATTSYSDTGRDPETEYTYHLKVTNTDDQVSEATPSLVVVAADTLLQFDVTNIPSENLKGAWAFEEGTGTTVDDKGPFNKTVNLNAPEPAWVVEGLEFDGTKAPVSVSDTSGMRELTTFHAVVVYKADVEAAMAAASQNGEWYIRTDATGHPTFSLYADTTQYTTPLLDAQVGNWVVVDAYRDGTTMGVRLNGNNGTLRTLSGITGAGSIFGNWQCTFGGSESAAEKLDGKVAFAAFYDRKLTDAEIKQIYNEFLRVLTLRGIPLPDLPVVQPPSGLTATVISPTQIDLTWDQYGEEDFKYYLLYRNDVLISTISTRETTTYSDMSLMPETEYTYTLKIEDNEVRRSDASIPAIATTQSSSFMLANIPATGLLSAWAFEEGTGTTTDDQGPENAVAVFSTPAPAWVVEGLSFNGSDHYLTVNPSGQLSYRPAYHIIAVFRAIAADASVAVAQGDIYVGVTTDGHARVMAVAEGTSDSVAVSESVVDSWVFTDSWRSGTDFGIRLNNDDTKKATGTLVSGAASWYGNGIWTMGRSEGTDFFQGRIAMVIVYDHKLTDAEVTEVYTEAKRAMAGRGVTLP